MVNYDVEPCFEFKTERRGVLTKNECYNDR